jgi:hypothetical protein
MDYSNKATWSKEHLPRIAMDLGYVLNDRFTEVFNDFAVRMVAGAKMTNFLFILAGRHFSSIEPPLERVKK